MLCECPGILVAYEDDELPPIRSNRYLGGPVATATTTAIRECVDKWLRSGTERYLVLRPTGMDAISLYNAVKGVVSTRLAHVTEGWPSLVAIKRGDQVYVTRRTISKRGNYHVSHH